ncbi:MAG: hypothetical protein CMJ35_06760 [Phycisphaerae bacterium]|nr:hypothetical protein [Phycisphaerae bacterium]
MDRDLQLGLISDDDAFRLSDDGAQRLSASQGTVEDLIRAASSGDADWGIAYEDGPLALLPHLGSMRASARVLGADVLRCVEAGDHAGAAARIAALYRMSEDVSGDRNLISSLVGMAIGNEANKLARHCLDRGVLDSEDAEVVLNAIHEMTAADRFGMRDSIVGEWRMIAEFLLSRAPEEGAGAWLLETLQIDADDERTKRIAGMDRSALMGEMGGWSMFFSDVLAAWDGEDRAQLTSVVERLKGDSYGALPYVIAPSVSRAIESSRQSAEDFDRLIERLEGIAD